MQLSQVPDPPVSLVVITEPSRTLGEQVDQTPKEERGDYLDGEGNAPFAAVVRGTPRHVAAVADPRGEDLAQGIEELLQACDLASDAAVGDLGLIHGYDHLSLC